MSDKIKILAIGDTADNMFSLKKFAEDFKVHLINFPRKQDALLTYSNEGVEFFDTLLISKQVEKIKQIKDGFDLCIVMSWAGARIAYLAGLNYIMYFVGGDIVTPPFVKNPKVSSLKTPVNNLNLFERKFYKKVLDNAIACIAPTDEYYLPLKKYRKDAIRMDRVFVDTELFNQNVKPKNIEKQKFTFLSAQRICIDKGFDVIWKALRLCKSDFEVIQVEWFVQRNDEEKRINEKLMKEKPPQVKLIPLIKRNEVSQYFMFADAILGQMKTGIQGGIERDAAFCKKPVICYTDPERSSIIDGKKVLPPFLPNSDDPQKLAELIDQVVKSKEFRNKLAEDEFNYIKNLSSPEKVANEWNNIFESLYKKYPSINRKSTKISLTLENFVLKWIEKLYYVEKMKQRNIESWGKEEYHKLMK